MRSSLLPGAAALVLTSRALAQPLPRDDRGDGRITREADSAPDARFGLMDANTDGRIEQNEVTRVAQARMACRMEGRLAKRFERLDVNGDGTIVRGEFAGGWRNASAASMATATAH